MPYAQVNNLDYANIKTALKEYLKAQTDFTDYDYEGSVISNLLDVLAYNTYYTAFNTNMVVNELFLDSATLRDNVVALAKQLGYRPRSITSPSTSIDFDVTFQGTTPSTIFLKAGSAFTTIFDDTLYQYSIVEDIKTTVSGNTAQFRGVEIKEGTYLKNYFTFDASLKSQRFILTNPFVDTSTIRVRVYPNSTSTSFEVYQLADNILNVSPISKVFYITEIEDEKYEITFGDGIFGRKLENGEYIEISYLTCNGPASNGANLFVFNGVLEDTNGSSAYTVNVSVVGTPDNTSGGEEIESIDRIKVNAPKMYGTQDRAVTPEDYAAILQKLYPATSDIIVFGGEEDNPPQFGKVRIAIKPQNFPRLTSSTKQRLIKELKKYSIASITPEIIDPSIIYIELISRVFYDRNKTNLRGERIRSLVIGVLENYINSSDTEKFNGKFRYSKFVAAIDNAENSITSNLTQIRLRKDFYPILNTPSYYELCFQNSFDRDIDQTTVYSTGFTVREFPNFTVYLEDRNGRIVLYRLDPQTSDKIVLNQNIGTVDYIKGEVKLYNLSITKGTYSDNKIELRVIPLENDITASREVYLDVDIQNSTFTVIEE